MKIELSEEAWEMLEASLRDEVFWAEVRKNLQRSLRAVVEAQERELLGCLTLRAGDA